MTRTRATRLLASRQDLGFEELRKRRLFSILCWPGIALLAAFGASHLARGNVVEGLLDAAAGIWLLLAVAAFRVLRDARVIYRISIALLGALFVFLAAKGDVAGNKLLWAFSFPLTAFYTLGRKEGLAWTAALFAVLLALLHAPAHALPVYAYAPEFKLRFFASFFLVSALTYICEVVREDTQATLELERNKLSAKTTKLSGLSAALADANEALRSSEQRLMRAQAIAHVGHLELDLASAQVWASEEAVRILGLARGRASFAAAELAALVPDLDDVRRVLEPRLLARRELDVEVSARRASDGQPLVLHATAELVGGAAGEPGKVLGVVQDVSERRRAEAERQRLEERLARSQKLELLGVLAGGVAHDLNNVLSGVVTLPEVLLMELPHGHAMAEDLAAIRDSGKKAAAIVQDLLTLARRGVTSQKVLDLNEVVAGYLASAPHEKVRRFHPDIAFEASLDPALLHVKGSEAHLQTTIMNLVSNAAEAMPAGGRVRLRTENRSVDAGAPRDRGVPEGEYVVVSVEDEGVGISPVDVQRIFEPFYTKKAMGRSGTGLGMTVVWGTVQDHGGQVLVTSAEGRGTTIEVYLPATREPAARAPGAAVTLDAYVGRRERILVVDDAPEQRELATRILEKLNYDVDAVASGEAALERFSARAFDLVLLDMVMEPGIDGLETYSRMLRVAPGQRGLIVSGFSETERVREAQRLGATGYVRKPYTLEVLGVAVREALAAPAAPAA